MATWQAAVFDRAQADVNELNRIIEKITSSGWSSLTTGEKDYWLSDPKGAFNISDINRIEGNVQYLADLFHTYGYFVTVQTKQWLVTELPTALQLQRILSNIQALADAYYTALTTPALPSSMDLMTWAKANNIEKILQDMKTLLENMVAAFRFCGEVYTGEV